MPFKLHEVPKRVRHFYNLTDETLMWTNTDGAPATVFIVGDKANPAVGIYDYQLIWSIQWE